MKIHFNLREPNSKSETPIYLVARWSGRKLVYPTGDHIHPKDWNTDRERPNKSRLSGLRDKLHEWEKTAEAVFGRFNAKTLSVDEFREALRFEIEPEQKKKKTPYLMKYAKAFIERKRKEVSISRFKSLQCTWNKLHCFLDGRDVKFSAIDRAFHREFLDHLKAQNLEVSHINKQLENFSLFIDTARSYGHHDSLINTSGDWKMSVPGGQKEVIALTLDEIRAMASLELEGTQKAVRDLFLIGFMTGQRWSDFCRYLPEHFRGDLLVIRQQKTKKLVKVPVDLWDGLLPVNLCDLLEEYDYTSYKIASQNFNPHLKEIARLAGITQEVTITTRKAGIVEEHRVTKCDLVTSHIARRSFCSILWKVGFFASEVMPFSGHSTEAMLKRYIGVTAEENANAARAKMETIKNRLGVGGAKIRSIAG